MLRINISTVDLVLDAIRTYTKKHKGTRPTHLYIHPVIGDILKRDSLPGMIDTFASGQEFRLRFCGVIIVPSIYTQYPHFNSGPENPNEVEYL